MNREMCILLNEAYEVLMDPQQRTAYNAELDTALAVRSAGRCVARGAVGAAHAAGPSPQRNHLSHHLPSHHHLHTSTG